MLRCTPSSIDLTSADVSEFENRFVARHTARLSAVQRQHGRVDRGPVRRTHRSITPAEQNPMHERLRTVERHAAVVITTDSHCERLPAASIVDSLKVPSGTQEQHEQRLAFRPLTSHLALLGRDTTSRSISEHQVSADDRNPSIGVAPSSVKAPGMLVTGWQMSEHGNTDSAAWSPLSAPPNEPTSEPRSERHGLRHHIRLRVERMRHRHSRSLDDHLTLTGSQRQLLPLHETSEEDIPLPKDAQFGDHRTHQFLSPALDPEASAFMPQVRFAYSGAPSSRPVSHSQHGSRTATHTPMIPCPQSNDGASNSQDPSLHSPSGTRMGLVGGRRRRGTDAALPEAWQHSLQHLSPVLDRYPIVKPPSQASLRRDSITSETIRVPGHTCPSSSSLLSQNYTKNPDALRPIIEVPLKIASSSPPSSCRPSHTRIGSLEDPHTEFSPNTDQRRVSNISAASGISGISNGSDFFHMPAQEPGHSIDAVDAFLQQRESPLDELSSQLGRVQVTLAGLETAPLPERSWDQHHSKCVSILNDSIFRSVIPSSSPCSASPHRADSNPKPEMPNARTVPRAIAFPSSPATTIQPQSPVDRTILATSPGTPSPSPTNTGSRAVRRTPRVAVFNDNASPGGQPQTPADVRSHRMNFHPPPSQQERNNQQSPISPVRIPPRTTSLPLHTSPISRNSPSRRQRDDQAHGSPGSQQYDPEAQQRTRRSTRRQRIRDENEQDERGLFLVAEEERSVWSGRVGQGSLDTTPPAAGRFERLAFGG